MLVIEDDPFVREALEDLLETFGLATASAETGPEGIRILQEHKEEIRAVILDVNLRGMTGRTTLSTLKSIDPTLKVILSSGSDREQLMRQFSGEEVASFLPKPYTIDRLRHSLQAVLD